MTILEFISMRRRASAGSIWHVESDVQVPYGIVGWQGSD